MNINLADINKIKILNKLKSTYRLNSVVDRKESSAEHSWSSLLLADLLITQLNIKLDRLKIYEMLMYHDIIEIKIGDSPLAPGMSDRIEDKYFQKEAMQLSKKLPGSLKNKYVDLFKEFSEQKTIESKFAKLVDELDAIIQELDYKNDWDGWTKEFFKKHKSKYFEYFPELKKLYAELLDYLLKNNYLDKELKYLVKNNEDNYLPNIDNKDFDELFQQFTEPFMDEGNFDNLICGINCTRNNEKATYVIKNDNNKLYDGILWDDDDVEMISNMDYMYCLPSWDWWINPIYNAKNFRKEYLTHIPGRYGYSVVFVNNNKKREMQFRQVIAKEKYKIVDVKRQYELNPIEYYMFYDYYRVFLPLKLSREINRINRNIHLQNPDEIYFVMRGGYLLSDLLNVKNAKKIFIHPNNTKGNLNNKYLVDDCIVMTRALVKMGINEKSKFTLSCLDCAIPKSIYDNKYPNANLDISNHLLNMYTCRMFEKNPILIGVDIRNNKFVYFNSLVRNKFINEIQAFCSLDNLDETVNCMAIDLFNYRTTGINNKLFEVLRTT